MEVCEGKLHVPQNSKKVLDTWKREQRGSRRDGGRMVLQDIKGKFHLLLIFLRLEKERKYILSSLSLSKDLLSSESNIWALH